MLQNFVQDKSSAERIASWKLFGLKMHYDFLASSQKYQYIGGTESFKDFFTPFGFFYSREYTTSLKTLKRREQNGNFGLLNLHSTIWKVHVLQHSEQLKIN